MIFTRPRGDAFDVVACFQTAVERGQAARALLERSNGSVRYFLNRPGIAQLRCMDEARPGVQAQINPMPQSGP